MAVSNGIVKRKDYLSWDDYFMANAFLAAMRSKDPKTQVGACIVDDDRRIVAIGYNGMPTGCSDDELPWTSEIQSDGTNKHSYVCHAEMNAILSNNSSCKNCVLYTTLFPCNECAKMIIQSGIKEIVYHHTKNKDRPSSRASQRLLDMVKIKQRQFRATKNEIVIQLENTV